MTKRRAQVVRDRVRERFEFLVDRFELASSLRQLTVQSSDFVLASSTLRDVVARLQNGDGPPLLVMMQRPSARDDHFAAVGLDMPKLAFPPAGPNQFPH